jgi:hypothetical protein
MQALQAPVAILGDGAGVEFCAQSGTKENIITAAILAKTCKRKIMVSPGFVDRFPSLPPYPRRYEAQPGLTIIFRQSFWDWPSVAPSNSVAPAP